MLEDKRGDSLGVDGLTHQDCVDMVRTVVEADTVKD